MKISREYHDSQLTLYQDEPLAEVDASDNTRDGNDIEEGESDEDGLTAATLEARYERVDKLVVF